jgi:all-trans-retinol 13,14-reductase
MSETNSKPNIESYKRWSGTDAFDAIVIGSGIGGMCAAALLAKFGKKRVLVLERHYAVGGFTHVFHRPGYEWDVGVHYLGDLQPGGVLRSVFDVISDGQLEWADMGPVYDRVVIGEEVFDFPKGEKQLRASLSARFPGEAAAIAEYFRLVKRVQARLSLYFLDKALPAFLSKLLGPLLRWRFLRFANKTVREVLERLTRDQKLIAVLCAQCGDYGLPPSQASFAIHATVASHYFEGGYYPIGGAGRIAETIAPVIEAAGGRILSRAEVAEIVVEGDRAVGVRMAADGRLIRAPLVISDAGVANTFVHLLPAAVAERYGLRQRLLATRPSSAHVCLYVGLKSTAAELSLPKHNYWIYPDEDLDGIYAEGLAHPETERLSVYISFPSAKDPDFENRCPGRATIDVILFASYEAFARWEQSQWKKRPADYEALKERLAARMLEVLYRYVPQVRGKVDLYELSTPLTTRHFANQEHGEIYGVDHTPERYRQKWLRPRTPISGLYLTGQDVVSCGVAGALMGGVLTSSAILRRNMIPAIVRSARERATNREKELSRQPVGNRAD